MEKFERIDNEMMYIDGGSIGSGLLKVVIGGAATIGGVASGQPWAVVAGAAQFGYGVGEIIKG